MAYRRILIGTDFSESAMEAARLAARVGGPGARYRVAHAYQPAPPPMWWPESGSWRAEEEARHEALLRELQEWASRAGVPNPEPMLLRGSVGREMAHEARAIGADLVVVGSRGQSAVERILLGSSARAILRAATTDTLIVHGRAPPEGAPAFRRILVATDFNDPSREAAKRALELAREMGAELRVAHSADPSPLADPAMDPSPRDRPGDPHHLAWVPEALHRFNQEILGGAAKEDLLKGTPGREIPRHAREIGADLLVLGTHGAGALERFLLGSVAEGLAERSPCPVLVARR